VVTKTWVAGPPRSVSLFPPFATNTVGTPHTVTATVRDQFGNPTPGQLVQFTTDGVGTPTPSSGANVTNGAGQATFTFTNFTANVTNRISAFVPGCIPFGCSSNTVIKNWVAGPPARLTLNPPADSNTVGTQHCVTATVTDAFGNPTPNVIVRFTVTGSVNTTGQSTTNSGGMATFCYFGPPLPGADAIHAYADFNNNGVQDPSPNEPFGNATKAWVLPPSTAFCEVKITQGGWIIAANGDRANFGGNARVEADDTVKGEENYQDQGPAQPRHVKSIELTAMTCSDDLTEGTIFGRATVDGAGDFVFRIDVTDQGEPGRDDTYGITMSDGYVSGQQRLQGGNVQIHKN
jgi:Big-like domain-containing protein